MRPAGLQPRARGHHSPPSRCTLRPDLLFLPGTPISYLHQAGCSGAEEGLPTRQSWAQIPGAGLASAFLRGSWWSQASRGSQESSVLCTIRIYFTIYLFFSLRIAEAYLLHLCINAFRRESRQVGTETCLLDFVLSVRQRYWEINNPPTTVTFGKRVLPESSSGDLVLRKRGLFLLSFLSSLDLFSKILGT